MRMTKLAARRVKHLTEKFHPVIQLLKRAEQGHLQP
jgi:hypothetical protein